MRALILAGVMLSGLFASGAEARQRPVFRETIQCSVQPYCGYWAPAPQVCLDPSYATFCEVWRTFPSGASYQVRWYWLGAHR